MIESTLDTFSDNILEFVIGESKERRGLLVKKHSEHLKTLGDFSFPNTVKSWLNFLDPDRISIDLNTSLLKSIDKIPEDLVETSKKWEIKVKSVKEIKDRIHVFVLRPVAIQVGLKSGLSNNDLIDTKLQHNLCSVSLDPLSQDNQNITSLRVKYLKESIQNLYVLSEGCLEKVKKVVVTSKSSSKSDDGVMILCGSVLNAKTGAKECLVTADEFIKLRQDEVLLIAQHRYGVRLSTKDKLLHSIEHLGESAVKFELLQTKPSSAVKINFDHSSSGSSKGAAFILYNCARLETIIKTYNDKVEQGVYPPLPEYDDTDFSLLTDEDEWSLVFNFILGFPVLLNNCVEINEKSCEFRPHHVCSFLSSMVRVFSQYYRKIRILTEPRKHLLPVLFARIHMLKVLNGTLKTCLRILNIKSVSQM